jgi:SAM-dependent methyltransferase
MPPTPVPLTDPASYDIVASEYYDPLRHPTCHNLLQLSRAWLAEALPPHVEAATTLEVGAGASVLAALLQARGTSLAGLELQDASAAMLHHAARWREHGARTTVAPAHATGRASGSLSLLVGSLADPYNTNAFWQEVARVLRPGGEVLVTLPSHAWSTRFRGAGAGPEACQAEFALADGRRTALPSHVAPLPQQMALLAQHRLLCVRFDSLGFEALPAGTPVSPKLLVFGDDRSSVLWGFKAVRLAG